MAQIYGWLPIADRTDKQQEWYPLVCKKQADGTYMLKVDTELSVDALSLNIDNLKIASTDQTVGNAKYIKVNADGTVHITGNIGVLNASDVRINPATEEKQDDTITKLTSIDGKDFATSAKQDTIIGHIDGLESDLASIKSNTALGIPRLYSGNANILSATVTFVGTTKSVLIQNMHTTNIVYVSFDGGTNWKTINTLDVLELECAISSLDIKANVDGTSYEILTTE